MIRSLALVALVSGCRAHVVLDPPPPVSTAEVTRRDYFTTHRALPVERGQLEARTRMFQKRPTFAQKNLVLANGVTIHHVRDLTPLVDADSDSARAIAAATQAEGRADVVMGVGYGVAGVSAAVGITVLAASIAGPRGDNPDPTAVPAEVFVAGGCAVGAVIGLAVVAVGVTIRDDEADARTRAFRTFNTGLQQKLALPLTAESAPR